MLPWTNVCWPCRFAMIGTIRRGSEQRRWSRGSIVGLYSRFILPRILEFGMSRPGVMRERPRVLADAHGEVLEIGFGTGLNLACYPPAVDRLVVVDPVEMLKKRVAKRLAAAPMPVVVEKADGAALPFDARRFDCVVSTWTLCTIPKIDDALAEIRRVLKPGGRFLFLEHGLSENPRMARWQNRVDWLQTVFIGGCHVNRRIDRLVADSGMSIERLERFEISDMPRHMAAHYLGVATVA